MSWRHHSGPGRRIRSPPTDRLLGCCAMIGPRPARIRYGLSMGCLDGQTSVPLRTAPYAAVNGETQCSRRRSYDYGIEARDDDEKRRLQKSITAPEGELRNLADRSHIECVVRRILLRPFHLH